MPGQRIVCLQHIQVYCGCTCLNMIEVRAYDTLLCLPVQQERFLLASQVLNGCRRALVDPACCCSIHC
jgi:hypothetical protein